MIGWFLFIDYPSLGWSSGQKQDEFWATSIFKEVLALDLQASGCRTACLPGETVLDPSHSGAWDAGIKSRIYKCPKKSECRRLKGNNQRRRWGSRWQWPCVVETGNRDMAQTVLRAFQGSLGDLNIICIDTGPERILYVTTVLEKRLISGSYWPFSVWHGYWEMMADDILNVGIEVRKIRRQWNSIADLLHKYGTCFSYQLYNPNNGLCSVIQ